MPEKKVISLLPAATEIICALGLENYLVGRSHECDFPQSVEVLPECTSTTIQMKSSADVDLQVKEALLQGISIYSINKDLVRALKPEFVVTQTQCEVCAVSLTDVKEAVDHIAGIETEIVSVNPATLDDIFNDIKLIGEKLGAVGNADHLIEELTDRKELIRHKLKFLEDRPKVACIEWLSPLMAAGNWTPELVELAGGIPILAENGKHSPYVEMNALIAEDPDVIIVAACGFSVERTLGEITLLTEMPGWDQLKAVKNNRFYIADGNQYFNRPGPRIIDTLELLAEIIHPRQFAFGYEGTGWLKFSLR